jgi:glycine cleavage system aminomethyltransferase T
MRLRDFHQRAGAQVADDGIPLLYHDARAEYHAALNAAVLLDRSHEARLTLSGADRFALVQRMSTNNVEGMVHGEGRQTIFTKPTARILDRETAYNRDAHL